MVFRRIIEGEVVFLRLRSFVGGKLNNSALSTFDFYLASLLIGGWRMVSKTRF